MNFGDKKMRKLMILILFAVSVGACQKDHFQDTGINDPKFDGTIMQFIDSNPFYFDTLSRIIRYAGLEETLHTQTITFFAPPDPCFKRVLDALNDYQLSIGADSVTQFEQVKPEVWKEMMEMYMFRGDRGLKYYSQVDTLALDTYKGNLFESINGRTMNIGTVFNDAVNDDVVVKYQGYRQLLLSYVPDEANPYYRWINCLISTSDVAPHNGRVHVLRYFNHTFGFSTQTFIQLATERGID